MPTHCNRKCNSFPQAGMDLLCSASVVNTTTTQSKMIANERATRSRKLNDNAYKKSENAVIAMPAVKILLIVCNPASKPSIQPLNMQTFQAYPKNTGTIVLLLSQRTKPRPVSGNTGHYTRRIHSRTSVQAECKVGFLTAFPG